MHETTYSYTIKQKVAKYLMKSGGILFCETITFKPGENGEKGAFLSAVGGVVAREFEFECSQYRCERYRRAVRPIQSKASSFLKA